MLPEGVLDVFDNLCHPDKPLIWVATNDEAGPHLVPVCFVKTLDRDSLLIGNVFTRQTEENISAGSRVAVAVAYNKDGWDGVMLKGAAEVITTGEVFEEFRREVLERSKGKRVLNSAFLVTVKEAFSLKPRTGRKRL